MAEKPHGHCCRICRQYKANETKRSCSVPLKRNRRKCFFVKNLENEAEICYYRVSVATRFWSAENYYVLSGGILAVEF
jgi:hypothetical protein